MSSLFTLWALVLFVGIGCAVTGMAMARKRIRATLILNAVFLLLMGASFQIRAWSERFYDQRLDAVISSQIKDVAIGSIADVRGAGSPEARESALKIAEDAVRQEMRGATPAIRVVLISEILALILIVLGAVTLTLALTRPDILSTRVKRDNQTAKNSAPVAATGVDL